MLQIVEAMGDFGRIGWWADGCPKARALAEAMMESQGHEPRMYDLAEDAELMRRGAHVAVESITPRCAPVSQNGKGIGVEGMLTELRAALDGVVTRKPRVAIYENSEGLWRQRGGETRERVEGLLTDCLNYEWESMVISPHLHCGVGIRRSRVFYVGVRRDLLERT